MKISHLRVQVYPGCGKPFDLADFLVTHKVVVDDNPGVQVHLFLLGWLEDQQGIVVGHVTALQSVHVLDGLPGEREEHVTKAVTNNSYLICHVMDTSTLGKKTYIFFRNEVIGSFQQL